jgi:DNA-binding CsgD family transcriptional regulator
VTQVPRQHEAGTPTDVNTASVGLVTIDTGSGAITSCNDAFAEVVRRRPSDLPGRLMTDFIDDDVKPIATAVMEGIRAGFISCVDGNVDVRRQTGSVGIDCWLLALGADRPHNSAMAGVIAADRAVSPEGQPAASGLRAAHLDPARVVLATLDDDWRIIEMAPGSAGQLGLPVPAASAVMPRLHELALPADAPVLDRSFGRRSPDATSDTFTLRLRRADERWLAARVTVSPLRGSLTATFGLVAWLMHAEEPAATESERIARLEDQLARIRQVVHTADEEVATGSVNLSELTVRQREIVERLLDGHRVDAIARDLFVSPSTVRNHLSAIFDKLGVASQSELVELLRGPSGGEPGGDEGARR